MSRKTEVMMAVAEAKDRALEEKFQLNRAIAFDGLKLIADAVHSGLQAIAKSRSELLDKQYLCIAKSLLERTIFERWNTLALGYPSTEKEPLCSYFCSDKNLHCVDPYSKFLCPVYLFTGAPKCYNRPKYPDRIKDISKPTDDDFFYIEWQTEFLTQILFSLDRNSVFLKTYHWNYSKGDLVRLKTFAELVILPETIKFGNTGGCQLIVRNFILGDTPENEEIYNENFRSEFPGGEYTVLSPGRTILGVELLNSIHTGTYYFPKWAFEPIFTKERK